MRNMVLGVNVAEAEVPMPEGLVEKLNLNKLALQFEKIVTLSLGLFYTLVYWDPAAMEQKFLIRNAIACDLGMILI